MIQKEIYLFDRDDMNGAIEVRDVKTDKMIYQFSYRHDGALIWNRTDAWRRLRELHLKPDLYKEVFKCKCGKILRIPDKFEARCDDVNNIEYDLKCGCGNIITIQCDTLKTNQDENKN